MKEKINITLDQELLKKLRADAKDNNRNLSNWIETLLYKATAEEKK